jgi:hypothetical protein
MTISAEPHLAFDRGKKLARGASGARLTLKNTTRSVAEVWRFFKAAFAWPCPLKRGKFASSKG